MKSPDLNVLLQEIQQEFEQEFEHIEQLDYESGLDSTGEPAAWIWVVFKADAPAEAWSWENRQKIRTHISDRFKEAGLPDWPYVRFRSKDEQKASISARSTVRSTL
jgi:hypothetical protein